MSANIVIVKNAQQFLARVSLSGAEVPAFVEVINWLASLTPAAEQPPEGFVARDSDSTGS